MANEITLAFFLWLEKHSSDRLSKAIDMALEVDCKSKAFIDLEADNKCLLKQQYGPNMKIYWSGDSISTAKGL